MFVTSIKLYTILEKNKSMSKSNSSYTKIENNIIKNKNIDFYFLKNYSISVKSLYLFFEKLLLASNIDIDKRDLVVLVLYCLSFFEKEKTSSSTELLNILKEKDLGYLIKPSLRSIIHLFSLFNIKIKKPIYKLKDIYEYNVLDIFVIFVGDNIEMILNQSINIYDYPEY